MVRPDVSEERKTQILDAATAVFAEKGFNDTRMDDIVATSGLSKGTLYWYFKGKDDIIAGMLQALFDEQYADLKALLDAEGTVRQRLRQFARHGTAELARMSATVPLFFECYSLAGRDPSVRARVQAHVARSQAALTALIQQGQASGEIGPVDAAETAALLVAANEGLELMWMTNPDLDLNGLKEAAIARLLPE